MRTLFLVVSGSHLFNYNAIHAVEFNPVFPSKQVVH